MLDSVKVARRLRKIAQFIETSTVKPEPVPTTLKVFVKVPGSKGGPITMYQYVVKVGETLSFDLPAQNATAWLVEVE